MIPHGIIHAVPVAEILLPEKFPEPVRAAERPQSQPQTEQARKESGFAKQLDREVQRRERNENNAPKNRGNEARKEERTKESDLAHRTKEPTTALKHESRPEAVKRAESKKSGDVSQAPGVTKEDTVAVVDPRKQKLDLLIQALEDWLQNLLNTETGANGIANQGPGGSNGLSGESLGPRLAIEAPAVMQAARDSGEAESAFAALRDAIPGGLDQGMQRVLEDPSKLLDFIQAMKARQQEQSSGETVNEGDKAGRIREFIQAQNNLLDSAARAGVDVSTDTGKTNAEKISAELIDQPVIKNDSKIGPWWKARGDMDASARGTQPRFDTSGIEKIEITPGRESVLARLTELMSRADAASHEKYGLPDYNQARSNDQPLAFRAGLESLLMQPAGENAQTVKAQPQAEPDVAIIVEDVRQAVSEFGKEGMASVRLRLHPPELGQLVVEFKRDDAGVRVEFHTSNPVVYKAIHDAGPKMIEKLADAGIDLGSLDVFLNNGSEQGGKSFSPLDSPDNPVFLDNGVHVGEPVGVLATAGAMSGLYFRSEDSIVDLLI